MLLPRLHLFYLVALPAALASPLYAQAGDWLFLAMLMLGLAPTLLRRRR